MKRTLFLLTPALAVYSLLQAQVPQKINYQAVVRSNTGTIVANQPVGIRFSLHDSAAGGTVLYSESHHPVTNAFGLINLQIGGGSVLSGTFTAINWASGPKFLQADCDISGGTNYTTLATVELVAVPYALQAGSAGSFSGSLSGAVSGPQGNTVITASAVNTAQVADNAITATKIAGGEIVKSINGLKDNLTLAATGNITLASSGNTLTIGNAGLAAVTAGPGIIIGGTAASASISASYAGTGGINYGSSNTLSRSDHTHAGQTWGVNSGNVLTLSDNDANNGAFTVYSAANSFNGYGIASTLTSAGSQGVAVYGSTTSTDPNSAAVYGQAMGAGNAKGVWGLAVGNNTYAVCGQAQGTGSDAGVFFGNVYVGGTLSKAAGSFKIDHPLDPTNKYLSHSFVESPDMMNIYDGNIVLDGNGEATVTLPDWFEALNRDFRYQLTAMGKPSPGIYVSGEVSGHQFSIAGGTPGGKISWMVTGIRHDPYAEKHRIPVEELKPAAERGSYLNGESYGVTPSKTATQARVIAPAPQAKNQ